MYRQLKDPQGNIRTDAIRRESDKATVPNDLNNRDWVEYQAWLAADPANQPLPPEE
jgi:hypothetical protein